MSKKLHATQIQSLRKLEPPEMAVFRHSRYRYFWEKCYGNPSLGVARYQPARQFGLSLGYRY